jgi:GPH family glycoside/pentoside/hexuronide:cation symporter
LTNTPARAERLPTSVKLAFSAPSLASAGLALPIYALMPKFYSDVVLAPLGLIAIGIALARAFDAITDPAMGWLSDRTNTRWGRRRPWLAIGAPFTAVSVIALFAPPQSLSSLGAALWFFATFTLYFLFHTVYWVPYHALGYELTSDYHERSTLFGWREAFALTGTVIAGATPLLVSDAFGEERTGYVIVGVVFAVLLVGTFGWLILRIQERPDFVVRAPNPFIAGIRRSMRNRPFRILLGSYVVSHLTGAIPVTVSPFFLSYVLQPENYGLWLTLAIGGYVGAGIAAIPFWVWLARRIGKRATWYASIWVAIIGATPLFFLGKGDLLPFFLLLVFTGTQLGAQLLHPAMQADVIDYDELHTGKRREAQYGSFWAIIPKFVAIPSAAIPLAILAALGYVPNQPQSAEVQWALSAMLGLAPAASSFIAFLIAIRFPINEKRHRAIRDGIEAHERGEAAVDPLTGEVLPPPDGRGIDLDTSWYLDHFSRRELQRVLVHGPDRALRDVVRAASFSLAATVLLFGWVAGELGDLSQRPGMLLTFGVVAAGFALTGFLFHVLRVSPALAMRRNPVPPEVLRAHLALKRYSPPPAAPVEVPASAVGG